MDQPDRPGDSSPDGQPSEETAGYERGGRRDAEAGVVRRRPRAEGETAAQPPVQIALALLMLFLFLLVLWVAWPFLSGG
ncbi:MAG: hypothetical protein M3N29_03285 [Chloroflexota bacterium]|nr:hypothetical protein [Chloroflexota bacterium]